jgi:tRNA(Arg) A34 adenosine deaminase TadA
MMKLAIDISARNVKEDTGGPFGCAIFERHADNSITLVSIGMNRVVALGNSTLHGETVAIQMAQKNLNTFSLQIPLQCMPCDEGTTKMRQFELFTSCEPCAMCLGATLWSGVSRIVCGAGKDDAEAIGFDGKSISYFFHYLHVLRSDALWENMSLTEGPVFAESYEHLKKAGIGVTKCVLKNEAAKVLQDYGKVGVIYNRS